MTSLSQNAAKLTVLLALLTGADALFAHDGHGMTGAHWHATDLFGFVAMAVLVAVVIWQSRK
jgi:hydrogenase/urease accessory protein HupE